MYNVALKGDYKIFQVRNIFALKKPHICRNFLYRDMKCGRICLSHGGQLPVLHRRKGSQHFMNQAKFHSTFPILLLLKSLIICS